MYDDETVSDSLEDADEDESDSSDSLSCCFSFLET